MMHDSPQSHGSRSPWDTAWHLRHLSPGVPGGPSGPLATPAASRKEDFDRWFWTESPALAGLRTRPRRSGRLLAGIPGFAKRRPA